MKASTSGSSFGSSSRKRWGRQPETIRPWPRLLESRSSADSRIVSTLSSCAESMNEQVFTITTSAWRASLVISIPSRSSVPTITSASTRFFAHPSEINADAHRALCGIRFHQIPISLSHVRERGKCVASDE